MSFRDHYRMLWWRSTLTSQCYLNMCPLGSFSCLLRRTRRGGKVDANTRADSSVICPMPRAIIPWSFFFIYSFFIQVLFTSAELLEQDPSSFSDESFPHFQPRFDSFSAPPPLSQQNCIRWRFLLQEAAHLLDSNICFMLRRAVRYAYRWSESLEYIAVNGFINSLPTVLPTVYHSTYNLLRKTFQFNIFFRYFFDSFLSQRIIDRII